LRGACVKFAEKEIPEGKIAIRGEGSIRFEYNGKAIEL